jgi:prepilin-type processing-associated H-X9-DG protein
VCFDARKGGGGTAPLCVEAQSKPFSRAEDGCNPCLPATAHAAMNVCMADGSVRALAAGMEGSIWWTLVTPSGGEAVGVPW